MSRWFEHPITSKTLEDDQVLNVLSLINEAKKIFNIHFGDPNSNVSPLDDILKLWPVKTHVKKEWLRRVLDNGPMTDMIQSMGVVISEFPMHSLYYIDRLISLVNLNKKRFAITSSELLTNIFDKFLLPKTRPLINFNERPLKILNTLKIKSEKDKKELPPKDRILSFWYFEEQLKTRYIRFLKALEELIKNEPDGTNKIKIVNLLHRLCKHKESQTVILGILVNKLGDKNKKVAGSAFSKLTDLGYENNNLLSKIVRSVRRFVFRPNLSKKAQYYAVQLLTRSKINKHNMIAEPDVADEADTSGIVTDNIAVELVQIYIGVFKRLVDNSKSKCDKLYSALMAGLSRALRFTDGVDIQKYIDSVFKLIHSSNLNLSIQCLKVLLVIAVPKPDGSALSTSDSPNFERFLRLVYQTTLDSALFFNSQKIAFIDILFKSIAIDTETIRVKAMVKRLLQLCLHHPEPGFVCVCLLFLSRLTDSKHKSIFTRNQSVDSVERAGKMPVIATGNDAAVAVDSDDENESIDDIVSDSEQPKPSEETAETPTGIASTSWAHYDNAKTSTASVTISYDAAARNPLYANADMTTLVELDMLANHYHPSVKIFAEKILNMEKIKYKSDPSEDMSLARFLDRFAYKNPKKIEDRRKYLQKSATTAKDEVRLMPVNAKEFANLKKERVPGDELFFHKYFNHAKQNKIGRVSEKIDPNFSDSDTEFDKFLMRENGGNMDEYNMSGSEMGDIDDDDIEFSDFSEDDFSADGECVGEAQEGPGIAEDEIMSVDGVESEQEEHNEKYSSDLDVDQSMDEAGGDEQQEESEEETIHSSKRKRLGPELANITTGALTLGKKLENIKEKAFHKIKFDRKHRRRQKNKGPDRKINPKSKVGNKKFKK